MPRSVLVLLPLVAGLQLPKPKSTGTTRRELLQLAGAASAALPFAGRVEAAGPDYAGAAGALKDMITADPDIGPTMVRLAWHSSGTYDAMSKTGGSGQGTIRFKEELAHGGNAGLDKMVAKLEPIHAKCGCAAPRAQGHGCS